MAQNNEHKPVQSVQKSPAPPAMLFLLAAAILLLMSVWEPSLLLPLSAFVAMVTTTLLLGQRLYSDLTRASRPAG